MKVVIAILTSLTGASAGMTGVAALTGQQMLVPAFILSTVTLGGLAVAAKWIDIRVRTALLNVNTELKTAAAELDLPLVYHDLDLLQNEIEDGMSLTKAAHELGKISGLMGQMTEVETSL
jgi:hypothetical protein